MAIISEQFGEFCGETGKKFCGVQKILVLAVNRYDKRHTPLLKLEVSWLSECSRPCIAKVP